MELYGVLLNTMSIQNYIFATNRLKENLGASHLVKNIYEEPLKNTIKNLFPETSDDFFDKWKNEPENMPVIDGNAPFEIGYIGGGNALLFFKQQSAAEEFIRNWSTRLLVESPGLIPATAVEKITLSGAMDETFSEIMKKLNRSLAVNKNRNIPQTILPRHGITAECAHTGYSMEVWCDDLPQEERKYISSLSHAKLKAAKKAQEEMKIFLTELGFNDRYTFTDELEKLGQQRHEESYIAIVHIDGNEMSQRFRKQKTLYGNRMLSKTLAKATIDSFKDLLNKIVSEFDKIEKEFNISKKDNKSILPIRPIIIGGDDITFVSAGKLGIYLAKIFLEFFNKKNVYDNEPLTACAGVAITKTKYPFYRGYKLSDELLSSAKHARKMNKSNGSWLDFHLLKGSISGSLETLRQKDYESSNRVLYMRPYSLEALNALLKSTSYFLKKKNGKPAFARTKLMELREVLYKDEALQESFIKELETRGLRLPEYEEFDGTRLIKNNKTPYLDMIELLELYPEFALKEAEQ